MFLVNSRSPLVTATCGLLNRRHPFYRRYGANLPISLGRNVPPRLRLLTQGTCVGSRYGPTAPLFTGPRSRPTCAITPSPPSLHYGSPGASTLGRAGSSRSAYPEASGATKATGSGAGILTGFPFRWRRVTSHLRTDLPTADEHCRGTLALPAVGILTRLCCYYRQDSRYRRLHPSSRLRLLRHRHAPLPDLLSEPRGIGGRLEPRPFSAPRVSAGELLRTP